MQTQFGLWPRFKHYWYWDPETNMFMHSRDWDFEPYTASQVVKWYGEGKSSLSFSICLTFS